MASYNRVILVGNLTRDIELRYTPGGLAVTDIAIAVNERRKNQTGEWIDEVSYVDITLFGRTAEVASEYLGKGSPILVEGRLKQDRWEQDGQKRSKLKVICDRMQMLGSKGEGGGGSPRPAGAASQSTSEYSSGYEQTNSATSQDSNGLPSGGQPAAGRGDAQPTGESASYDEPDIPF